VSPPREHELVPPLGESAAAGTLSHSKKRSVVVLATLLALGLGTAGFFLHASKAPTSTANVRTHEQRRPEALAPAAARAEPSAAAAAPASSAVHVREEQPSERRDDDKADDASQAEEGATGSERRARSRRASQLVSQGHDLRKRRNFASARARYLAALDEFAGYPRALAGLAQLALAQGNTAEALRYAQLLVKARPGQAPYQLLLGDAYRDAGKLDEAQKAWHVAARQGSAQAKQRLGA
jgi:tetratricopeptide (TPR) repeat protein